MAFIETLEPRVYFSSLVVNGGVLNIYGTTSADQIDVRYQSEAVGDANLDGKVTTTDFSAVDSAFLLGTPSPTWENGDFNSDGVINYLDYQLLHANFPTPTLYVNGYLITDGATQSFYPNVTHVNVVTIGGGADTVTGSSVNTDYWVDSADSVSVSPSETSHIHSVGAFYQPWTTDSNNPAYVPLELQGQNLADPTDTALRRYAGATLWGGAGPQPSDVAQGTIGDCYFIAGLQALAASNPQQLESHIVDLGDGTFAVDYLRSGVHAILRVDGDFTSPNGSSFHGDVWPMVAEKAFAMFRTGANTYASIASGNLPEPFSAFDVPTSYFVASASMYSFLQSALTANRSVDFATNSVIPAGVPMVANHAYTLVNVFTTAGVQYVTIRNPWGVDGFFSGVTPDSNPGDGLVTVTMGTLAANSVWGDIANNNGTAGNGINVSGAAGTTSTKLDRFEAIHGARWRLLIFMMRFRGDLRKVM